MTKSTLKPQIFNGKKSPYNPDWVMVRDNCSREEAEKIIADYKRSKATTLENFIRKHGEEKGRELFAKFQKTSVSRKPEMFKTKEEYDYFNRSNTPRCPEYWLSRNLATSISEARELVSNYQLTNSGTHLNFYLERGYSRDEAIKILLEINKRKIVKFAKISYKYLMNEKKLSTYEAYLINSLIKGKLFKDNLILLNNLDFKWYNNYLKSKDKIDFVLDNLQYTLELLKQCDIKQSDFTIYRTIVLSLSQEHDLSDLKGYKEVDEYGRVYEMDHIYSVKDGYDNQVDPLIVASKQNLRFIPKSDNGKKWKHSHITLTELLKRIQNENSINSTSST